MLMFVVQNANQYNSNTEVHTYDTTHSTDLHLPFSRLSTHQKVTLYMDITYLLH